MIRNIIYILYILFYYIILLIIMGLACGTLCARDKEKLSTENAELAEFVFYKHLEETRS